MALKIPQNQILQHFVDRVHEVGHFRQVLGDEEETAPTVQDPRIIWIHGGGGIGKSLLLSRMMEEAAKRGLRWSRVEFTTSRLYDYLGLMRKLRDDAGKPELFQLFNDKVNRVTNHEYTVRLEVDLGDIQDVEILKDGTVRKGGNTINVGHQIQDLNAPVLLPEIQGNDAARQTELTEAFFKCLEAYLQLGPAIFFVDGVEHAKNATHTLDWIRDEFMVRMRDGDLANLVLVLAGRSEPPDAPDLLYVMRSFPLQPFECRDIEEYLRRRGVQDSVEALARMVLAGSNGGRPDEVARLTELYLRMPS